ncbi:hypothetical protein AB0C77_06755 [Streptomyces sp. NPDC048629]|uniref:hypothetical protein n=1 Tax=Streptomyces sp. NPDC048629 TaxID=3154824 RepID=UPI003411F8DF
MTDQTTTDRCPSPESHYWGCGCPTDKWPAANARAQVAAHLGIRGNDPTLGLLLNAYHEAVAHQAVAEHTAAGQPAIQQPADRAAGFRAAADELDSISDQFDVGACACGDCALCSWKEAARHLRRLANETAQ